MVPALRFKHATEAIAPWHLAHRDGADLRTVTRQQIEEISSS